MRTLSHILALFIFSGVFFLHSESFSEQIRNLPAQQKGAPQASQAPEKPAAISGQSVKSEYFSLTLPEDWILVYPLTQKPDGISGVFTNNKTQVTVTLNIIKYPLSTQKFTDLVLPGMRQSNLNPSKPVISGDLCRIKLNGQAKGEAWLSANGQIAIATVILAPTQNILSANIFLKALQSPVRNMYPSEIK